MHQSSKRDLLEPDSRNWQLGLRNRFRETATHAGPEQTHMPMVIVLPWLRTTMIWWRSTPQLWETKRKYFINLSDTKNAAQVLCPLSNARSIVSHHTETAWSAPFCPVFRSILNQMEIDWEIEPNDGLCCRFETDEPSEEIYKYAACGKWLIPPLLIQAMTQAVTLVDNRRKSDGYKNATERSEWIWGEFNLWLIC